MRLGSLLLGLVIFGALAAPVFAAAPASGEGLSDAGGALVVTYFYSPACIHCQRASKAIDAAQAKFGQRIRVERHNVSELEGLERMLQYEAKYGIEGSVPPQVFVAAERLDGADAIIARLETVIRQELDRSLPGPSEEAPAPTTASAPASRWDEQALVTPAPSTIPGAGLSLAAEAPRVQASFQSLRIGTIALAGLADGINPCAFTTIVFLLSAMAYLGKTRRQVAVVGLCFTGAVFVTYLLLGFGLMAAIRHFSVRAGLSQALTYIIAALAFLFAAWSFFDGIRAWRSGKVPRVALGLPSSIKAIIRRVIKAGLRTRYLVLGSLAVGFLVSVLESFCTGQLYVPTLLVMVRAGGPDKLRALALLLLYNVMFILPLAGIMVAAYCGVRSQRLGQVLRDHLPAFKFAMAGVFAALAAALLLF